MPPLGPVAVNEPTDLDRRRFRDTMGRFATGVTVVTTVTQGELYGMTVSAFTSVSLDPALVLICVDNAGHGRATLAVNSPFSVSILSTDQDGISRRFADRRRPSGTAAFAGVPFRWGATNCPVIVGSLANVDCRTVARYPGGDHTIIIGRVISVGVDEGSTPLVFYRGTYGSVDGKSAATKPPSRLRPAIAGGTEPSLAGLTAAI